MESKVDLHSSEADQRLQQEFNQWAAAGRGDEMESHHSDITEQTLAVVDIQPGDRILDLGCGTGWASRPMARVAATGEVVALDVADEMLRRAEHLPDAYLNVRYPVGGEENDHE